MKDNNNKERKWKKEKKKRAQRGREIKGNHTVVTKKKNQTWL